MNQDFYKEFICPECFHASLKLQCFDVSENDVLTGSITCMGCQEIYQISNGIPYLINKELLKKISDKENPDESKFKNKQADATEVSLANAKFHNIVYNDYEKDDSTIGLTDENSPTQKRIEDTIQKIAFKAGNNFFADMGCGSGNVLKIAKNYFHKSIGVDISTGMAQLARNRQLNIAIGDIYHSFFRSNSLDMVTSVSVLHHLLDTKQYFTEIHRILLPGGYMYTDWDPNQIADGIFNLVTHQTKLFIYILYIYNLLRRKTRGSTDYHESDTLKDLAEIAEYHLTFFQGFNPALMKQQLLEVGFSQVEVIYVYNNSSIFKNISLLDKIKLWSRIVLGNKFDILNKVNDIKELSPHFALLAKK